MAEDSSTSLMLDAPRGLLAQPVLDATKRREIAESVISGRKSGADMARLYSVSQPTVSRIVAKHRVEGQGA
jgi:hypothetical protein